MGELRDAEPIRFDFDAAALLCTRLRANAELLRTQVTHRNGLADGARRDWCGAYEMKFGARMLVCATDAERLAHAMDTAVTQVEELERLARQEQDRRTAARAWKVEHDAWQREQDEQNALQDFGDWLGGGDDGPEPPDLTPAEEPGLPIVSPDLQVRE